MRACRSATTAGHHTRRIFTLKLKGNRVETRPAIGTRNSFLIIEHDSEGTPRPGKPDDIETIVVRVLEGLAG